MRINTNTKYIPLLKRGGKTTFELLALRNLVCPNFCFYCASGMCPPTNRSVFYNSDTVWRNIVRNVPLLLPGNFEQEQWKHMCANVHLCSLMLACACMHACMYAYICVLCVRKYTLMGVARTYACPHVCIYVSMYDFVCVWVFAQVCLSMWTHGFLNASIFGTINLVMHRWSERTNM